MLSLSNGGMTAGHAGKYFSQEDYYLKGEEPSQWLGKSAATFRLQGGVKEAAFRNLANGKSPDGMRQLVTPKITKSEDGTQVENHRAGNDLTFSAPKSLSIGYAAGNRELKEIWDQAVVNTMKHVEEHYSHYRTPSGVESAGNIIAAKFDHVTSRALDPEVHSHVFLLNMVQTPEGWQANEPKNIYQDKIAIGMLAREEAINLYRKGGYPVYFTDREQLLFEIEGVRREEIEAFSKRRSAILDKVSQWKEEKRFPGVSDTVLKQMAALETRDPKRQVTQEDVRRAWDKGFEAAGTTAIEVRERIEASRSREHAHETEELRHLPPGGYPESLATIVNHTNLVTLKKQPGYEEGKRGGDIISAYKVVDALVKPQVIHEMKKKIPENSKLYIIPVVQREGPRLNMLPVAYAERLAEDLGGEVWTKIQKVSGKFNTGAGLADRLNNVQIFLGEMPPEGSIIIVADDTFTAGGTLAALIDQLALGGRTPLIATTLAVGRYGKELRPTKELTDGLLQKAGLTEQQFQLEFGYPLQQLTAAEMRAYLFAGRRGVDGARALFHAAGAGRGTGKAESLEAREPPLEPPGTDPSSVIRTACALLTEKEVVFDRALLLKTAVPISGGRHSIAELNHAIDSSRSLHFLGCDRQGWNSGREFFTTREMLELEARNVATLRDLNPFQSITSREEVSAYLKAVAGGKENELSPEEKSHLPAFKAGAASASHGAPVLLSPGQRQHIMNDLAGTRGFAVTQGDPGTGKTFCTAIIERFNSDVLKPTGRRHLTVNLAYTGKAALEIEKAGGTSSFTIDSFLARIEETPTPATLLGAGRSAPIKTQMVIKVDEASLVGGGQAARILSVVEELRKEGLEVKLSLVGDTKQMQSIQASPFFRHASDLAREEQGDYAVMKEITRQKDEGLLAVARCLNRNERYHRPLGTNATDALKMLQQQGRVVEIPERAGLVKAAVERYLSESSKPSPSGEKQSVLIVASFNTDRHELNREIRQARLQKGEVRKGETVEVLVPVEHGVTASSFQPQTTVIFGGKKTKNLEGVRTNRQGEVRAIDTLSNKVKVDFPNGRSKIFEASDLAQHSSLYRREPREFSKGDLIVFGKNTRDRSIIAADGAGKTAGVRNGERGEITELRTAGKETVARIRMFSDGRNIELQLTRFGPQHIDHGYAVTVHKGQGETVDSVISFNYVKPLSSNDKNRLQSITGMQMSEKEYSRWNSSLSDLEKSYQAQTRVGGHAGQISFVMIADPQNAREQKGIAITFSNGRAVVEDESARAQMREGGMYWSPTVGAWVTAATNDSAIHLIPRHPLKDPQYVDHLESFKSKQSPSHPEERNYTAAIDTTADRVKYGHASYNAFNVAMTRAKHEASLFTNSVPGLRKSIQLVDQKTTTISRSSIDRSPTSTLPHQTPPLTTTKELQKELKLPKR